MPIHTLTVRRCSVATLAFTKLGPSPSSPSSFLSRSIFYHGTIEKTNKNEPRICSYGSRASPPPEDFSNEPPMSAEDDGSFFDSSDLMEEDEGDDEESTTDLFFKFLESMFRKAARRAKRGPRSVLPPAIPPHLVSFAVDGVLLLTSLSILKALLEVVCAVGGSVFAAIFLIRLLWATTSYFQSNGNGNGSSFNHA